MRIRVSDVLDLLANGLTPEQVIEELPDLEAADVEACLRFASRRVADPCLAPARQILPRDEWEQGLLTAATDCDVSLSNKAVSSAVRSARCNRHLTEATP